jgi:hypothetical protein
MRTNAASAATEEGNQTMMTDDEVAALIASVANAANPRDAYLEAQRRLSLSVRGGYLDTERLVAQYQAIDKAGSTRGLGREEMETLYYAARGQESPHRSTDPERVGRLAHLLSATAEEHGSKHKLLIAEKIMAAHVAVTMLSRNCTSHNCRCGELALERVGNEIKSGIGTAALKLAYLCEEAAAE